MVEASVVNGHAEALDLYGGIRKDGLLGTPRRRLLALSSALAFLLGGGTKFEPRDIPAKTKSEPASVVWAEQYTSVYPFFENIEGPAYDSRQPCIVSDTDKAVVSESEQRIALGSLPHNTSAFFGVNTYDKEGNLRDRDFVQIRSKKMGNFVFMQTGSAFSPLMDVVYVYAANRDPNPFMVSGDQVVREWVFNVTPQNLEITAVCL